MADQSVPAFAKFIADMRTHFAKCIPETEHWRGVRDLLKTLVTDGDLRDTSLSWEAKKGREYILHHDPDYDFFVGALVREPDHVAGVHDHGSPGPSMAYLMGRKLHTFTVVSTMAANQVTPN